MGAARFSVPRNVERQLWSESCGFCMNPECLQQLITEKNIGEMAHIVPHAKGGDVSVNNLILLCANCHRKTEPRRVQNGGVLLREWKAQAKKELSNNSRIVFRVSTFWKNRSGQFWREIT